MKTLKRILLFLFVLAAICYVTVYLLLPYFLNKNDYSKTLTNIVKEKTGLILYVHNYKLDVSPTLNINVKADEIQLFYPDKRQFLNLKQTDFTISTLYLLKKEIKLNKAKAGELQFSTKLLKNGKTTLQQYLENNTNGITAGYTFSQKYPDIFVSNYIIKLKDEESGQKFKLKGKNFKARRLAGLQNVNIETQGDLYCFNKKYFHYTSKVSVPVVLLENTDNLLLDFTIDDLYRYDFSANINTDIKLHARDKKFAYISGKADIDNFKLKLGNKTLPPSFFHIVFDKNLAKLNSKFYTGINEAADITADIKLSKPYKINMVCKCPKADIANLQKTIVPVLNLFKIKNNLSEFNVNGTLSADFKLQTDLKNILSNGSLKISNASIAHKSIPLKITSVNALIDFSNNAVNIKQSDMLVNNQPLQVKGSVDKNAVGDIVVTADNLDLNHIMNAFPLLKPEKNITVTSGKVSFSAKIKGQLNQIKPDIKVSINNFSAFETVKKIKISINELLLEASGTKDKYNGKAELKNILAVSKIIPNNTNSIKTDKLSVNIAKDKIQILPAKINAGNAKLMLSGVVNNYSTSPAADILLQGTVDTALVKSFLPDNGMLFSKGYLPLKALIKSKNDKTTLNIKILANPNNYITPVIVNSFDKVTTLTEIDAQLQASELCINNAVMYYAGNTNSLLKEIDTSVLKKAIIFKGKITNISSNPLIEKLHIQLPSQLNVNIPQTKDGTVNLIADLILNGSVNKPEAVGQIKLFNLSIPSIYAAARDAEINLNKNKITAKIENLKIKDMDLSIVADIEPDMLSTGRINYLKFSSSYLDMDYAAGIMSVFNPSKYAPGNDFPYVISSGDIDIKSFKMGVINAQNITAKMTSQKNNLYINNLQADAYGGKATGSVTYNFPYTNINAKLQAKGMNASSAAAAIMPAEKGVSGTMDIETSINMMGLTQEQQLNTLKGDAVVHIKNGRLGQLGRFEHFLYAQNLLSQKLIYASLNSAKQAISPKDTGIISYLNGNIKFSSGYAHLSQVFTSGPQMSMFVKGKINLTNQFVDLKILGKISPEVSSSLGMFGSMTIKDFLDEHTKYGGVVANLFSSYNIELPEVDISKIPALTPDNKAMTKNFQVIITGNPDSISSVRSFTWVNPKGTKEKLLTEQVKNAINEALPEKAQQNNTEKLQEQKPQVQSVPATGTPDFLDRIPDDFK